MTAPLLLASGSAVRRSLLENAGVEVEIAAARIDEDAIRESLLQDSASPRDIADLLAELKARKTAGKMPGRLVLGCDQVLDADGRPLSKPADRQEALAQLRSLGGRTHRLHSAAVLYRNDRPLWRHVSVVRMHMARRSDDWLEGYVARNWDEIRHCVGAYQLEAEGARLFSRVEGDYFAVLGLPLIEVLNALTNLDHLPS